MKISILATAATTLLTVASAIPNFPGVTYGRGSPGCGFRRRGVGHVTTIKFVVGGSKRKSAIFLPGHYEKDRPSPLILAFHANRDDADDMEWKTRFSKWKTNHNFAVQYMQRKGRKPRFVLKKNRMKWLGENYTDADRDAEDFKYTQTVLDYTMNNYCIDVDRVYLVGDSDGSGFANILACDPRFSYHFAGMALSGIPAHGEMQLEFCKDARLPMPVIEAHGTIDIINPYWGWRERNLMPVPAWIKRWVRRNDCDPVARRDYLNSKKYESDRYTCQGQFGYVEHIKLNDWDQEWPTQNIFGLGLDFSEQALAFLQRFVRPGNLTIPLNAEGRFDTLGHKSTGKPMKSSNFTISSNNTTTNNSTTTGNLTTPGNITTSGYDATSTNKTISHNITASGYNTTPNTTVSYNITASGYNTTPTITISYNITASDYDSAPTSNPISYNNTTSSNPTAPSDVISSDSDTTSSNNTSPDECG